MKSKKIISVIIVVSMILSMLPAFSVMAEEEIYVCDFTQLVKDSADTVYGTADDVYTLDEYTKAYLTYENTYVSAGGKVYLTGPNNGKSGSVKGSYIEFTAPSAGKVTFTANAFNYFVDNAYTAYGRTKSTVNVELKEGQVLKIAQHIAGTYVETLSFAAASKSAPTPTAAPDPTEQPDVDEPEREVIYNEDFEEYSDGDNGGWTSPAGVVSVKTDSNSELNKYLALTSGKNATARSGYKEISTVNENFVLEADVKSTAYASNVSAFEVLEQKGSLYANHGCYSNGKYIFKMNRPSGLDKYVINNAISDSGLSLERYTQPTVLTKEIPDEWLHVKVIGNFADHTVTAYITSLDRKNVYYHGRTDMSPDISSFKLLALLAPSSGVDTCIDNIKISKALDTDLNEVFHTVTINNGINEFSQYVYDGECVVNIPDMSIYGTYFEGWGTSKSSGLVTSEELASQFKITKDEEIQAYISKDYIENLAAAEFKDFPSENQLVMGADGDTFADNIISLTITGERGTSLVTNPDSRVTDYKIDWRFDGFRIMDGSPTGENGSFPGTQMYCDSYGKVTVSKENQSSVNFELKNTSANYYGTVTAEITYNGKTITVSKPLLLLADKNADSNIILPKSGYTADYNKYDTVLAGYKAKTNDILLGGWSTVGSDSSNIELKEDNTGKHLSLSRALSGNSSYFYQTIGDISSQTVFSQDIRFGMSGEIAYGTGKAVTDFNSTAFELDFSATGFVLNGSTVCTAETGKWYHIEITADPTTKLCFAKIYNLKSDGNYSTETPIGKTELVSFKNGYTSGGYYRISIAKERNTVDINNVTIIKSTVDENSITVTAPHTVNIPSEGTVTADFSVKAETDNGDSAIGAAIWEIADEFASGVSIAPTGADTAVLTVESSASSGDVPIKVTINGTSVVKTIKLVGTNDNIAFTDAQSGVLIPTSGNAEYIYTAEVRNGNAETVSGRTVKYTLCDKNGTAPIEAEGVTLSADGKLTVSSNAAPQNVCILAVSTDEKGSTISKSIKVNIYNLKFDFGKSEPENGYTAVTADINYSESMGFGITGNASDNDNTLIGSDFGFNVKLEKGNVYEVKALYSGMIKCERIDADLSGFERTKESVADGEDTYRVAVFGDGVMDLRFSGNGEIDKISIEKIERTANEKPAFWTIGDSTVQQNGSWAYTIASESTADLSEYPELAVTVSAFYNSGRAGRQHRSYYTEGLMNSVLCRIKPGDIVSISGMGTNDSASSKDDFKRYNNQYIDAIADMGGKIILGSYTPTGNYGATEGKVYDSDNILFKGVRTNSYDTAIREVYAQRVADGDESIIGFVDIGQLADNMMSNDVRDAYNKVVDDGGTDEEARTAANVKADELMSMWKDYNHYYTSFSNYILPSLTKRFAQVISGENQDELPKVAELKEPKKANSINVISVYAEDGNAVVKIDRGFTGVAVVCMYNTDGSLAKIFVETDNTVEHIFDFKVTENNADGIIKLINLESLETIKPYGAPRIIKVDEIGESTPSSTPENTPGSTPSSTPNSTIEITSSEKSIDVSMLEMYGNSNYRMYSEDGCADVTAENGKVANTTGKEVTIVPVYRFEFTNTAASADEYISGYIKVGANSYTKEKGYGLLGSVDYSINENGCKAAEGRPIKADVPDGFYDITVYRRGGCRADVYNNGVQIINNTTSSGSQNRPSGSAVMTAPAMSVTDGINLTIGNVQGNNERVASVEIVRVPEKYRKSVIWIAGDSESANYYPINADGDDLNSSKIMMTGFGMQLEKFLSDKYAVANYGQPSATVKTWYNECFESVNKLMQKGDTILIDFGINDAVSSSNKITADEMKQYMQTIIEAAKEKEVTPILISPVYNGKYQHKSYFTYSLASKENAMYEFAEEMGIECVDLNKYTQLYVSGAISKAADGDWRTNNYHVSDNLHLTQHSALLASSFIAAKMKSMGYETNDYEYVYKDISSIGDGNVRGEESGVTRTYSVAEAEKFIKANTEAEPVSVKKWDFTENDTAEDGYNKVVLSGNVEWNETHKNLKFDANSKTAGTAALTLNPAVSNNVTVDFDLNVGSLGQQYFEYVITDAENNELVRCKFARYNGVGTLAVGTTTIAEDSEFVGAIACVNGDGMSAGTTAFSNEIDFDNNTVTVTIGSKSFSGKLTGAETKSVSKIEFIGSRSKTADRSVYLDNISVKEYTMNGGSSSETAFADYAKGVYQDDSGETILPYRIYNPSGENIPVLMYLHGETRKGSDNESQMYNAQYMFEKVKNSDTPCILVAPQCPKDSAWADMAEAVIGLVGDIANADTDRIYIAGYGEGAEACYDLLAEGDFAAALPISGKGDISLAPTIAGNNSAVMAFNGGEESENSRDMIKALANAGVKNAEYVELYGENSNIQKSASNREGVLEWMFSKSITANAQSKSKRVDLAVFMGQSNMAGRGNYKDATAVPVGHGYEFRSVTQPDMLFNITGPFGKKENNNAVNDNSGSGSDRRSGDMVSSIMASYYDETGVPIVGVQCSRGGTNTGYWTGSAVKTEAQARLTSAKNYLEENGYTIGHIFMVWCQGESDGDKIKSGSQSVDGYKAATLSVFEYMKEVGVTDMFIVKTGHYNGSDDADGAHDAAYTAVNAAQQAMADENDNVYVVASLLEYKENMIDSYHFNQTAYNAVGKAAGKAIGGVYAE